MDWITTSGGSLDEAKSHALDQLGIVADEAEFDIVNDVEKSFFGRVKTEAKVRARVRPKQPAIKEERGGGRRRSGGGGGRNRSRGKGGNSNSGNNGGNNNGGGNQNKNGNNNERGNNRSSQGRDQSKQGSNKGRNQNGGRNNNSGNSNSGNNGGNNNSNGGRQGNKSSNGKKAAAATTAAAAGTAAASTKKQKKKDTVEHEMMARPDQEQTAQNFLEGVLGAFGMDGSVAVVQEPADDDAIEMAVTGQELGLLVGQKGMTLNALQELTRTVVQREADGAKTSRLRVDVAGYRARRTEALQEFARKIAADVIESGNEKLLEPMGPADRKVVHDTANDIDGVETGSEGEEPRRRVVIRPT